MRRPIPVLVPLAAAFGLLASARARADVPSPATWWIEARPWTCARYVGPVARAVQAACDADGGGCALAAAEGSASRRLILFCQEGSASWRVRGETADHAPLWSASFDGGVDDRPARIGRFAVREGGSGPAVDAPTPRSARAGAVGSSVASPSPARSASPPLAFTPQEVPPTEEQRQEEDEREEEREEEPNAWSRSRSHEGGLSVDAFIGFNGQAVRGAHAVAAFSVGAAKVGVGVAYASDDSLARFVRTGVVAALGAPWDSRVFGSSLEVGASVGQTQEVLGPWHTTQVRYGSWGASPYAQWTMIVQIPVRPVRPWIGTSALFVLDQFGSANQTLSLVGGISWNAW